MNVAVFTDNDFDKVNGVTTALRALLRWSPSDIRPRIYTADGRGRDDPDYLSLRSPGIGIPFYAEMKMYVPRLAEYVRRARRDAIDLVHLTTPGPVGLAALWVSRRLGLPLIGSFHTDLARYAVLLSGSRRLGLLMGEYLRWPYGRCARVMVPSRATSAALDAARVARGRHALWTRGVDTETFTPARRSAALRHAWGADDRTPVVIYVGRVSREKGLDDFVALQRRLREANTAARLVIVGDGPMRRELAQALPDAVFTGTVAHDRVAEHMASADLLAFPSRTDTAGNVVLEAQACALPAVVRAEGGPPENVEHGRSGFACGDLDAFVDATSRLASDAGLRAAMSGAARGYALTRDWPSALAPLFDTYREFATARAAPAHRLRLAARSRT